MRRSFNFYDRSINMTIQFIVISGEAIEGLSDEMIALNVRGAYREGARTIHIVDTDAEVVPRLTELGVPRRDAWLCPECGEENYGDVCDTCGNGVAPWDARSRGES